MFFDKAGYTLDIQLRKKLDYQAAYAFMKRLIKMFREPTFLTIENAPALLCAFKELKEEGFYTHTTHCTIKHLNNLIEQDHRHVKQHFAKSARFQNIRHASRTIKEIEAIHALYKQRRSLQADSAFSVYHELQQLLVAA